MNPGLGRGQNGNRQMRHHQPAAAAALVFIAMIVSGCVPQDHGWANAYMADQNPKIAVVMPANAPSISQEFRYNSNIAGHEGIDVIGKKGSPVIAAADGVVIQSFYEPLYGNRLVIDHGVDSSGKRTRTVYKHLQDRQVALGARVSRGQQIATLGATGSLAGGLAHLHFEIHRSVNAGDFDTPVDPHLFWAGGTGRVTCYSPDLVVEPGRFKTTYPVACR